MACGTFTAGCSIWVIVLVLLLICPTNADFRQVTEVHKPCFSNWAGSLAQEDDFVDAGGPRFKQKDGEKEEADGPSDWRLPSSPAMALQLAQEDLRNRLGSLYAERVIGWQLHFRRQIAA